MDKEIKTDHFKTLNELLETCKIWIDEEDWYAYNRYFEMQCMKEMYKYIVELQQENQKLKKQLEYLRSGEYYNQLRFERDMLQNVVDNGEVSKEDKEFIDMTHRNTELLEQQEEFIEYMNKTIEELQCDDVDDEEMKGYLIQRIDTFKEILSKFKSIIGGKDAIK